MLKNVKIILSYLETLDIKRKIYIFIIYDKNYSERRSNVLVTKIIKSILKTFIMFLLSLTFLKKTLRIFNFNILIVPIRSN